MPIIHVHIIEGRSPEAIEKMISAVTDAVATSLGADPATVRIMVHETPNTHWGIGGQTAKAKGR